MLLQTNSISPIKFNRRRFLQVVASTLCVPLGAHLMKTIANQPRPFQWTGVVLGAKAALTIWSPDKIKAEKTVKKLLIEINRLERIFSLYFTGSEISKLNQSGYIDNPSTELVNVLLESENLFILSDGAFDPSIQDLWKAYFDDDLEKLNKLIERKDKINFSSVNISKRKVAFDASEMKISLNGIAQGFITDKISDLLKNEGYETAMVELGETRALGAPLDGDSFEVGIINPHKPNTLMTTVTLENNALAVSGGYGFKFPDNDLHHILDPHSRTSANKVAQVVVTAPSAMSADGLSTAIFVAGVEKGETLLKSFDNTKAMITDNDGNVHLI